VSDTEKPVAVAYPSGLEPRHKRDLARRFRSQPQGFDSAEHIRLGDGVYIWQLTSLADVYKSDWDRHSLALAPDLTLTYGQIVALAGDLYVVPDHPISDGADLNERKRLFRAAFDTLVYGNRAELRNILAIMAEETAWIAQQTRAGVPTYDAYAQKADEFDKKYMDATGFAPVSKFTFGRYVNLALKNFDHFGNDARKAWIAGHTLAIEEAVEAAKYMAEHGKTLAGREEAYRRFQLALGMNAFADHFLTDLFSAGHLRVPRRHLSADFDSLANVDPLESLAGFWDTQFKTAATGSWASKFQHEEDGNLGLFVHNRIGKCWKCFGDGRLATMAGDDNARLGAQAVQDSMSEVWMAFRDGFAPVTKDADPLRLVPDLETILAHEGRKDHPNPLNFAAAYIAYTHHIEERTPFNDVNSHQWSKIGNNTVPHPAYAGGTRTQHSIEENLRGADAGIIHFTAPARDIPAPTEAPTFLRYDTGVARKGPPVAGRVRWALAFEGRVTYPNGSSARFLTDTGPWSAWVATSHQHYPRIHFQRDPTGKAVKRVMMRQFEGQDPLFFALIADDNTVTELTDDEA
jgi:hypothetical protein